MLSRAPGPPHELSRPQEPSDWDKLIARAQQESLASAPPRTTVPSLSPTWSSALAGLVLLLIWASVFAGLHALLQAPRPTPEELDAGRRAVLALVDASLADHLRLHGDYPDRLEDAIPLQVQVIYRRSGAGYEAWVYLADGRRVLTRRP